MAVTSRGQLRCHRLLGPGFGPAARVRGRCHGRLSRLVFATYGIIGNVPVTALSRHWLSRTVQLSGVHWHGAKSAVAQSAFYYVIFGPNTVFHDVAHMIGYFKPI